MTSRLLRHPLSGRYSALECFRQLVEAGADAFWLDDPDGTSYIGSGVPWYPSTPVLEELRRELSLHAAEPGSAEAAEDEQGAPLFRLGLVGWLGYELRGETLGGDIRHPPSEPSAAFLRVDRALAITAEGSVELLALGEEWDGELAAWRDATVAKLNSEASAPQPPRPATAVWRDDRESYLAKIAACQRAIHAGDAYLLNLTTEVEVTGEFDARGVYERLRALAPSHHGGYLSIGGTTLASASPERFLEVSACGTATTHPVKGTRPRSTDAAADEAHRDDLITSVKERAENVMIVDLMRNDLGRVCEPGSVRVPDLLFVETYEQVHQLVSTVSGRLKEGLTATDAVGATLPAGSMTGAPKNSAIGILDSLETRARGLYAGAFGYFGLDGRADLAMTIRSIVLTDSGTRATIGVGGGITALSVPDEEFAEVHLKAAAPLRALGLGL